jgi:hypothetical protein
MSQFHYCGILPWSLAKPHPNPEISKTKKSRRPSCYPNVHLHTHKKVNVKCIYLLWPSTGKSLIIYIGTTNEPRPEFYLFTVGHSSMRLTDYLCTCVQTLLYNFKVYNSKGLGLINMLARIKTIIHVALGTSSKTLEIYDCINILEFQSRLSEQ